MRLSRVVLVLLCAVSPAIAQQQPPASPPSDPSRTPNATHFDGTWGVTLKCADYKDTEGGAKGYTKRFMMQVKDGSLVGEYKAEGTPGWLRLDGRIQADGTGEIEARGLTSDPVYSVAHVSKSTPYAFRVKARFAGSRGTGTRVDLRPCELVFVRQ